MYRRQNIVLFLLFVASLAFLFSLGCAFTRLHSCWKRFYREEPDNIYQEVQVCSGTRQSTPIFVLYHVCMYGLFDHIAHNEALCLPLKTQFCKHTLVQGTWFTFFRKFIAYNICSALFCNFSCILRIAVDTTDRDQTISKYLHTNNMLKTVEK